MAVGSLVSWCLLRCTTWNVLDSAPIQLDSDSSNSYSSDDVEGLASDDSDDFDEDNEDYWDRGYRASWGTYGRCYNCGMLMQIAI